VSATVVTWANVVAFVLTLAASTAVAWAPLFRAPVGSRSDRASASLPRELKDHSGDVVRVRDYDRIVSASTVADALLVELCEPDRVIAFTAHSALGASGGYRYAGKPRVDLGRVESVLSLHPDLVLVNAVGDPHQVVRLRDAGVAVFDLGEMRGQATLVQNIREVAVLVGHPERGERYARRLVEQMRSIALDIPGPDRETGMYLSVYGGRPFGGASGTSYHDVLVAAGLVDAAARFDGWPEFTTEQVLGIDPQIIVTDTGMRQAICEHAGFTALLACRSLGGVVEVDDSVLGDPGPGMIEAAQIVRDLVYGPPPVAPADTERTVP
jgi:iron complex transport system substrate-binding protein